MDKAVALLSGGIDSPVAIHLMKDRLEITAVHFHQRELTDEKEIDKVKDLARILKIKKTYLIPFTTVLKEIVAKCSHQNYYILQKILMMKAAEIIAEKEKAKFLITGENLAQVSSQTLSNLATITSFISLEIFRPVLAFDKQEIIDKAKVIGTYETSSGPEICSLLGPKHPATRSDKENIRKELEKIDFSLVEKSITQAEIVK
ncbi:MAG TPA: 7-cyano-7-deazaguanine synthase [Candidatus Nanoarchaeia archaeon]|nr:7-cyano-7-deazaguanine synthase [Candidatus Nanoarchaeia archaeon]